MAPVAAPLQIAGRSEASGDMRLAVFLLVAPAVAAIDALDPVELGRLAQLQCQEDLDRSVAGPAAQVSEILSVVEDPAERKASEAISLAL